MGLVEDSRNFDLEPNGFVEWTRSRSCNASNHAVPTTKMLNAVKKTVAS